MSRVIRRAPTRPRAPRRRTRRALPWPALAVLGSLTFALSACGGGTPKAAPPKSTTTTSIPAAAITTPTVTIGGRSYTVPLDSGLAIPNNIASGHNIIYTSRGFLPFHLFASLGETVVWTNLSNKTITLHYRLSTEVTSPPIPPGGTYSQAFPTLTSFEFTSSTGYRGILTVGAFQS